MYHLVFSIFCLFLFSLLVLLYLCGFVLILAFFMFFSQWIKRWKICKSFQQAGVESWGWLVSWSRRGKRAIIYFSLAVLVFNIFLYGKQRIDWMGEDNGNLTAKEYWVAGQVVYAYRALLSELTHPDRKFIQPMTRLQWWIYEKGVQYLPKDDGERGVWTDIWFVYPYSKRMRITIGAYGYKPSPRMMALVERSWSALEMEATGTWADQQMRTQHYLRNFPGQAFYYLTNSGFLTGKMVGSRTQYVQDEHLMKREKKLLFWLKELPQHWNAVPGISSFVESHPKDDALRIITLVEINGNLIHQTIFNKSFSCNSDEVDRYLKLRNELVGEDNSVLDRMRDRQQAETFYHLAVNTQGARFLAYSLHRFCGLDVAGDEDMSRYHGTAKTPEQWRNEQLSGLFPGQVKILEEMYHGR